jgi:DNA-binding transcriptional regulator YhcF (GntR family)
MEFYVDKHSSIPVVNQIQEQIKFAVMMGIFRNGDTLPSIRDIQKQTGVNRSQLHRAYLGLRQSGLLVLTRGKGTVISTATDSPRSIGENCRELSKKLDSRVRRLGMSPSAFARYFSRYAQESERNSPFILYVDDHREIAAQTAAEISQLWQVPVEGLTYRELRAVIKKGIPHRILVNHVTCENVRSLLSRGKSAVIPIEVRVSEQTIKLLAQVKPNSSLLIIHMPQPSHRAKFIVAQLKKLVKTPGVKFSSISCRDIPSFQELLNSSQYDYFLVGPGVRGEVPSDLRQHPRILQIYPELDSASLEAARVRVGVVV